MGNILVIDDEKGILELISEALTKFGHIVETDTDGLSALRRFKNGGFDLVITDMCMPNIDGPTIVKHIRRSSRPNTPVIGISGTPWFFQNTDCDAFLAKPFSLINLIGTVKEFNKETDSTVSSRPPFSIPLEARSI
jgi:CheY-like chemotaxis protein